MGFHRLAIMGLNAEGMQPFWMGKNRLVCNGEIYGFRPLKKELEQRGYAFHSESDCEILLPLYAEHGTGMFRMLDAEFALVLYDGETGEYIAARDPIGIRPLYYGTGIWRTAPSSSRASRKTLRGLFTAKFSPSRPANTTKTANSAAIAISPPSRNIPAAVWTKSAKTSAKS